MMKKLLLIVGCISLLAGGVSAAEITIEGTYQGKNLYVQNPFAGSGVGFCVFEVTVNGQVSTDELSSSAFEIDFTAFSLTVGQKVNVVIKHKDDCKPKVLNPEVLKPQSTFEVVAGTMKVDGSGNLVWQTKNESGKLPFVVEQFRWNKWVKVGEVDGKGKPEVTAYSVKIYPHSGENKFRVKQVDFKGPNYSEAIKYRAVVPEVSFAPLKVDKEIQFSEVTMYEIFDMYGNIVKKGSGDKVDVGNLKKGAYYINYDNKTGDKFVKK